MHKTIPCANDDQVVYRHVVQIGHNEYWCICVHTQLVITPIEYL